MTLKLAQFCDDPKNINKILIPQKIFIFLKTQKNIEIQNFEPKKNGPSLRMCENIRVPPLAVKLHKTAAASVTVHSMWNFLTNIAGTSLSQILQKRKSINLFLVSFSIFA